MHISSKVVTLVLGAPGSGKSTFAAQLVKQAEKIGVPVYSNYPILGTHLVEMDGITEYNLGKSVLIIDEAGLHYFSRNTRNFSADHNHWYSTTRHRETQVFVIVQAWNRVDVVLRQLATEIILCKKSWFGLTKLAFYNEDLKLAENSEGYATEFLEVFERVKTRWFWRPSYYHMFDTHHLDREYKEPDFPLCDVEWFPAKQPLWRRLLGLRPKPATGLPDAGEGDPIVDPDGSSGTLDNVTHLAHSIGKADD